MHARVCIFPHRDLNAIITAESGKPLPRPSGLTINWRIAFILAGFVFASQHAAAASFDCTKAKTEVEKAVCTDPELSRLDETLSVAYKTALGGLSPSAAADLKSDQHHWLAFADRACSKDGSIASNPYDEIGRDCLATVYQNRINILETSRMFGGYRFYPVGRYRVRADKQGGANATAITNSVHVAKIDGASVLARAFNAAMSKQLAAAWRQSEPTGQSEDDAIDSSLVISADKISPSSITTKSVSYSYQHGAAHGLYGISYLNFLTDEKRLLAAKDIFMGAHWKQALATLAYKQLRRYLGTHLNLDEPKEIVASVSDPTNWLLQKEGLRLQFQPYEVAPYSEGAPSVTVSWRALKRYLARKADKIIHGY